MPGRPIQRLRPCFSLAKHFSRRQARSYAAKVLTGEDLGPIHHDEHHSFRVLKDGSHLPIPPVLDPIALSERSRWEQTKQKPDVNKFTPFQKKLWENPYGTVSPSPLVE